MARHLSDLKGGDFGWWGALLLLHWPQLKGLERRELADPCYQVIPFNTPNQYQPTQNPSRHLLRPHSGRLLIQMVLKSSSAPGLDEKASRFLSRTREDEMNRGDEIGVNAVSKKNIVLNFHFKCYMVYLLRPLSTHNTWTFTCNSCIRTTPNISIDQRLLTPGFDRRNICIEWILRFPRI